MTAGGARGARRAAIAQRARAVLMVAFASSVLPGWSLVLPPAAPPAAIPLEESRREGEAAAPGFAEAVAAYRDGRYERAWWDFAALAAEEPDASRRGLLHANAGTAAARAGRLGHAVWHLEGARRLRPRDDVVETNLALVRARLGQSPSEAASFAESLRRLPLRLTAREARLVVAGLVGLGLVLLAWRRSRLRPAPGYGLVVAVLVLALGAWVFDRGARARDRQRAIVLEDAVALRAEPDRTGSINFRAGAGTIVVAEERRGEWRLVETREGARGWVPADAVREAAT